MTFGVSQFVSLDNGSCNTAKLTRLLMEKLGCSPIFMVWSHERTGHERTRRERTRYERARHERTGPEGLAGFCDETRVPTALNCCIKPLVNRLQLADVTLSTFRTRRNVG